MKLSILLVKKRFEEWNKNMDDMEMILIKQQYEALLGGSVGPAKSLLVMSFVAFYFGFKSACDYYHVDMSRERYDLKEERKEPADDGK